MPISLVLIEFLATQYQRVKSYKLNTKLYMETKNKNPTNGQIRVEIIAILILSIIVVMIFSLQNDNKVATLSENDNQKITHSVSPSTQSANNNEPFTYTGNAQDELGNRAHYVMKIKRDFSEASINGPYQPIELLSNGRYQFIGGTIMGLSFNIDDRSCILYNFDRTYFCTLYRTN